MQSVLGRPKKKMQKWAGFQNGCHTNFRLNIDLINSMGSLANEVSSTTIILKALWIWVEKISVNLMFIKKLFYRKPTHTYFQVKTCFW